MAKPFRFMGRDPISKQVALPDRVHVVPERDQPSLCGVAWPQAVSEGWITRDELRTARHSPALCDRCQDVMWGVRRG